MSDSDKDAKRNIGPGGNQDLKHEPDDLNVWAIVKFGIGLFLVALVVHIGLLALLRSWESESVRAQGAPPPMARAPEDRLPPKPRLQKLPDLASQLRSGSEAVLEPPDAEMQGLLSAEDRVLDSYGWVDKNAGKVRIPIERAINLLLEKGVPSRPSAGSSGIQLPQVSSSGRTSLKRKE